MTTPMMQQWHEAKAACGDGILFFRMGDFYEFFHDDAKRAARLLGLTLTARSKGPDSIPMAGIPVRSVDGYVKRLVREGEKVVICEQVEDPAEAKGIVQREITRIVTPGTITEEDALERGDDNFLVGAVLRGETAGMAWADVSTGEFRCRDVPADRLLEEIQRLDPAECLFPEGLWLEGQHRERLQRGLEGRAVTTRPDWCFESAGAARRLNEHFGTRRLAGFGVEEDAPSTAAAGALLEYLTETQKGAIGQMRRLLPAARGGGMLLDRATRSSLEIVRTLRDGERSGSLLGSLDRTATAMGARLLKAWLLEPLLDVGEIRRRQDAVAELVEDGERRDRLREALVEVLDLGRLGGRIGCGRAHPRDLDGLRQSLARLPEVAAALEESVAAELVELREAIPDLSELSSLLERALADEPPPGATEGGVIREGHDPELDELRALGREGKGFIASFQSKESAATGIPSLKVGYNRVFGYYLEVTNAHRDRVPERWIRKQTLKNAERYVTPELKEYEDKVLNAEERAKKLEYELFVELRAAAEDRLDDIQDAAGVLARLDVLQSLARVAADDAWVRPEVDDGRLLRIEEGRHPVVSRQRRDEPFVPNDVDLDEARRVMLITGPNMAGKSTYIRQVALLTLLAQIGSFVPARAAQVGIVDRIFTRVGASDDLAGGASTFMVEMLEVANILNNAGERSLVILDEVGRGTSTFDGLSLAWAITEHLARVLRSKTLFATHYHELVEIAEELPEVVNFNVAVREWGEEIVFLHRIVPGGTDKSYGIHVARLAGLPDQVLERSRGILGGLEARGGGTPEPAEDLESRQLDLFSAGPDPLRERLAGLDLEGMTPIAALTLLDELRREARR